MSVLGYLQKVGRALMVPVAVLPAAAIMMGIGYWLDPNGWGNDSAFAAFLIQAGAAIIDKMPILFAVGVAYGMSKDKDGAAALAGLVGYLVLTTLLKPAVVAQIQSIPLKEVPAAFGKIENQFVGILCGIIAAELYNRFSHVELNKALAFFSGRRLVPIVTSAVMILVAFVLMIVWPYVFGGLVAFGETIAKMDALGAGIYGFFNRLLIPVGLHHALNSVFWFDVAGINDIPNFLGGAKSLAEGVATVGITGRYQAGFFPVMMFGLPAAAFAIYRASPRKQGARGFFNDCGGVCLVFYRYYRALRIFFYVCCADVVCFARVTNRNFSVYCGANAVDFRLWLFRRFCRYGFIGKKSVGA